MSLYHREVFWKDNFDEQAFDLIKGDKIKCTQHFINHILYNYEKRYNIDFENLGIILEKLTDYGEIKPFEVEVEDGKVVKAVIRVPYDNVNDISIVFRKNKIITAWLNKREDKHFTLDKEKYEKE